MVIDDSFDSIAYLEIDALR